MVMVKLLLVEVPTAFVAVTTNVVEAKMAVGVPEITPVALMDKPTEASVAPAGTEAMVQLVAAFPVFVGVKVTGVPTT